MAAIALTVFSPTDAPVTVGLSRETWEELTVEIVNIIYDLPALVIVDTLRNWMRHDGTEPFTMELLCVCGGVCGLTKMIDYTP